MQLDDRNPFKVGLSDVSAFLALPPIQFLGGKYIDVKAKVETYLQKTFYNLTTVALHNWRTYGRMRALAAHKYKVGAISSMNIKPNSQLHISLLQLGLYRVFRNPR